MTASTTSTWELRRDQVTTVALQLAGVLNAGHSPSSEQKALGATLLQMSLTALQADGIIVHTVERYSQTLTDGQVSYAAPSDTLDIEDGAVVRNTAGYDSPIYMLSTPRDYLSRGVKTVTGQPTEYFPEKQSDGTFTVYLYPIPTADWPTLIYPRVRKLRDTDTGSVTPDVPVKFLEPVTLKLAAQFCRHYNRDTKAKALMEEYETSRERVMADETQRGPMRMLAEPLFGPAWGR